MSDDGDASPGTTAGERRYSPNDVNAGRWVRRGVLILVVVALAYVAYLVAAAFFPRWWSQRVADQVNGHLTAGTLWGLFYGFVFTVVPLIVLAQVRRRFFSWEWRGIVAIVAVLLATPNWLTLSVVAGNSKAAHAGERIMDVDAPGFRVATAIGAVSGAVIAIVVVAMSMRLAHQRREVKNLRGKLSEQERERREDQTE